MRTKNVLVVALSGVVALTVSTAIPRAQSAPNIVWQTTFNCPDWNQTMGLQDGLVCATGDGLQGWGGWSTANGSVDSITAAANFSGGAGGKGFRHMRGDGSTNNGGGLRVTLPTKMGEIWIRYYMRYQAGFRFANDQPHYTKDLYLNSTVQTDPVFTMGFHSGWYGVGIVRPGSMNLIDTSRKAYWRDIMNGPTGDGQYHSYEVHVKMDTNGSNGIAETWVDGTLAHRDTNVNWGGSSGWQGWSFFILGSNQHDVTNSGVDMYTDFDDVVISSSGYIGPVGGSGGGQSGPSAPTNLRIAP